MKTNDVTEAGFGRDAYQRDYDSSVSGMGRPADHRGLRQELAHETNNIAVYINSKLWKVWAGKGTADSREERAYLNSMQGWADKKSAATGKKWTVGLTGANVSEATSSVAVRMQRAADKQRAKSDASLARTPSSIPKKEEPNQPIDQKGVAEGSEYKSRHAHKQEQDKAYADYRTKHATSSLALMTRAEFAKDQRERAAKKKQGVAEGAPIVVMPRSDRFGTKKPAQPYRNQGDIVPPAKPPSTEKRGVKGRPGQRPMPEQGVAEGLEDRKTAPGWHSGSVKNPNFNDELSARRVSPPGARLKSGKLSADERGSQERTKALMKFKREKGGLTGPKGVLPEEQGVAEADETNPKDKICVDVPLFIRLMEYAREDAATDMDLHSLAERLTAMSADGETLGMDSYDAVVGNETPVEEASLAQMRDYFTQNDSNTVELDNKYGTPERGHQQHVPPEIQSLINKMYRVGKITPKEFDILKNFQLKTKINVGLNIKEADKNPYAIGMSQAMKSTGDNPPLKKSTINKAHEIAKKIKEE